MSYNTTPYNIALSDKNNFISYCGHGNLDGIKLILSAYDYDDKALNCLINHTNRKGKNPLIIASENGQVEVIELLFSLTNENVKFEDMIINMAIFEATFKERHEIADIIVDLNLRSKKEEAKIWQSINKSSAEATEEELNNITKSIENMIENDKTDDKNQEI